MFNYFSISKPLSILTAVVGLSTPAVVDPVNTIALWNFDEASGSTLMDSVSTGFVTGTVVGTVPVVSANALGAGFVNAREFGNVGSYVSFGPVAGTKLDRQGEVTVSLSAMIYLNSIPAGPVTIFDNSQIQLQVINNKLAGFVRQASGFIGVTSQVSLLTNTPYRVSLYLAAGRLAIAINEGIVGNVIVSEAIAAADPSAVAVVGGDSTGMTFPGVIDDVVMSKATDVDTTPPVISLISPDLSSGTMISQPHFTFSVSDNLNQIDPGSLSLEVNGISASGLVWNASLGTFSGQLNIPLTAGKNNQIRIEVSDLDGNKGKAVYEVSYINRGSGEEYQVDSETLALWHMNEDGAGWVRDESSSQYHGRTKETEVREGIFGQARYFNGLNAKIDLPPISMREGSHAFTFEAWINQNSRSSNVSQTIFDNKQIRVDIKGDGAVEFYIATLDKNKSFVTAAGVVSLNQWQHLKIVFDGSISQNNLLILANGLIVGTFTFGPNCDFDDTPKVGEMGVGFTGLIDEVRISKVVRQSSNLVTSTAPKVSLVLPKREQTVSSSYIPVWIEVANVTNLNSSNVEILLNGQTVPQSQYSVSAGRISGRIENVVLGVNSVDFRVLGNDQNQVTIRRRVVRTSDSGLVEYQADADTVALWHMDSIAGNQVSDASGNNRPLTGTASIVPGMIGNAASSSSQFTNNAIPIPGRVLTIEFWFKRNVNFNNMFSMGSTGSNLTVAYEGDDLTFSFAQNAGSSVLGRLNGVVSNQVLRHYAFVIDGNSAHSNFQIYVDGILHFRKDVRINCTICLTDAIFTFSQGTLDEIRISKIARKSFGVGASFAPVIGYLGVGPNSTVSGQAVVDLVAFASGGFASPINFQINGTQELGLSNSEAGDFSHLYGISNSALSLGLNQATVQGVASSGGPFSETFNFYRYDVGAPSPYGVDVNTLGLWHFDGSGAAVAADSSGNNFNLNFSSPTTVSGVFSEALRERLTRTLSVGAIDLSLQRMTWEGWVRLDSNSSEFRLNINSVSRLSLSFGAATITPIGGSSQKYSGVVPQDGEFHHYAFIVNSTKTSGQYTLLVDGKVSVVATRALSSIPITSLEYYGSSVAYDEFRFSNVERTIFNSAKPVQTFLRTLNNLKLK